MLTETREMSATGYLRVLKILGWSGVYLFAVYKSFLAIPEKFLFEGSIVLLMVTAVIIALVVYHTHFWNPFGVFSPLHMFLLPYSVYFIVFPIDMFVNDKQLIPNQDAHLPAVMVFLLLGLLSFLAGFFLQLRGIKKLQRTGFPAPYLGVNLFCAKIAANVTALLALALFVVLLAGAGFSSIFTELGKVYSEYFTKQVYLISVITALIIVSLSINYSVSIYTGRYRGFIISCCVFIPLLLLQGSRGVLISVVLVPVLQYHIFVKKINFRKMMFVFFAFLLFLTAAIYVRDVKDSSVQISNFLYGAFLLVNDEMTQVLTLVDGMPQQYEFQHGKTFLKLFSTVVPRTLWENKPVSLPVEIKDIFFPHYWDLGLSWPPSIVGELFANFGMFGVVIGLYVFGYICGKIQNYTLIHPSFLAVSIFAMSAYMILQQVRGDFMTVTSAFLLKVIIFILFTMSVYKPFKES